MFFFARYCCLIGISLRIQYVRNTLHCVYIVLGKCEASAIWKKEVFAGCVSMAIQSGQQLHGCHTSERRVPTMSLCNQPHHSNLSFVSFISHMFLLLELKIL